MRLVFFYYYIPISSAKTGLFIEWVENIYFDHSHAVKARTTQSLIHRTKKTPSLEKRKVDRTKHLQPTFHETVLEHLPDTSCDNMAFTYKTVLMVGCTSGIGLALAERMIENGVFVIGTGRRKDKLDEFVAKHGADKAAGSQFDITNLDGVKDWAAR